MRYLFAVLALSVTIGLCWFLDHSRFAAVPFGMGRVLDPFHGVWQNMEGENFDLSEKMDLSGLEHPVKVHYDDRKVPHIFAENDHDLYFMQGFVTARDRLWQMEFQIFSASGRLSELIDNPRAVELDRMRRRTGMVKAAEDALAFIEKNPLSLGVLDAYTQGVNAWIDQLTYQDFPVEYKLLDYSPEHWSNLKTSLLLKLMAWDLTGRSLDFQNTNTLMTLDSSKYADLFPYYSDSVIPIIPRSDSFPTASVLVDSVSYSPQNIVPILEYPQPHPNNGSNNWAVSGKKTASGYPILCNDPHLSLRLPAIWYEVQLTTPEHSVYGVSLPGAPCVTIG
ncbi:MAG TPA: penicillin acylase family protein, partial [Bacteroidetes bacterium]|nr:penicillin acylase family protein [Bacteroidota bacterium]